jgi:hypothetical protein
MQFEQGFLGLFLGQTMSAQDRKDGMCDLCVANYLAEFNPVHLSQYSTSGPEFTAVICLEHLACGT